MCCLVYGWVATQQEQARSGSKRAVENLKGFQKHMMVSCQNINEGRFHTLLTSSISHVTLPHLLVNMFTLWSFGPWIITRFGARNFAVLWLGSSIACGGAAALHSRVKLLRASERGSRKELAAEYTRGSLGASGALLGMLGTFTCSMPSMTIGLFFIPMKMWQASLLIVGGSVACMEYNWLPNVGHDGHLGGLAFGALWYLVSIRRGRYGVIRR